MNNITHITEKYKSRFKDGKLKCNRCKKLKKLIEYKEENKTYCIKCTKEYNKKRHKRSSYKLW